MVSTAVPGVPAGASSAIKAKRAKKIIDGAIDSLKSRKLNNSLNATTKRSSHGNSLNSKKAQHGYEITDTKTGEIVKTGISGGKKDKKRWLIPC